MQQTRFDRSNDETNSAHCCIGDAHERPIQAESPEPLSDTGVSKEVENPVTRRITVPLRYEADFLDGPYNKTKDTFSIDQAVLPFHLTDDWALITRTKLPAIVQPPKKLGDHWAAGLSNGYTTFFLSPEHGEGLYWGVGPVLYYPSATNSVVGVNKWGSGPSAAFIKEDESPWVFGSVANNIWSFGSPPGSSERTYQLLLNPFVSYHFDEGWSVGSSPNITTNWINSGGKWTVPVGGRLRQGGPPRRAADKTRPRRLLQRDPAQGSQRDLAVAGHRHLSVSRLAVEEKR
jgi:hypothetical protein